MKILAIDLSGVFRRFWEVTKHKDISEALTLTLKSVSHFMEGFDRVALCCDAGQSFRKLLWPASEANGSGYKGNRTDPGETYREQLRICKERLSADGCTLLNAPEYVPAGITLELGKRYFAEADDVIATVCTWARAKGHTVRIVTSDKDLLALVDDEAGIECQSIDDGSIGSTAEVFAKFGVAPTKIPLFLALAGDDSDGFKPYAGLGPTSATKLIVQLAPGPGQTIADIWARPERIPELIGAARGKALVDAGPGRGQQALLVATLVSALAMDFDQLLAQPVMKLLAGTGGPPPGKATAEDIKPPMVSAAAAAPETPPPAVAPPRSPEAPQLSIVRSTFDPYALEPRSPKGAWWLAEQVYNARCFGERFKNVEQHYVVILEGRALGMNAITSLKNAYIVNGQVGWSARCMRGLCLRHPSCRYFRVVESTMDAATAIWKRGDAPEERMRIDMTEAKQRGFLRPGTVWMKDHKVMLVACVEREGSRLGWPDVVAGLVTPDELEQGGGTEYAEIVSSEAA